MTFRLITLLYVFALVAASLAVFGAWGILVGGIVLGIWALRLKRGSWQFVLKEYWPALLLIVVVAGFIWPLFSAGGSPNLRTQSLNNLKQIALALHNYHAVHGKLPPPYVSDDDGNPLYSWRVLILPYIQGNQIHKKFRYDEPWDSRHNKKLLVDLEEFISPRITNENGVQGITNYVAVVGDETAWQPDKPTSFANISDGTSDTIVVIEVGGSRIQWSEPTDISMEEAVSLLTGEQPNRFHFVRPGHFVSERCLLNASGVAFADGHANVIDPLRLEQDARSLLTRTGGEPPIHEYDTIDSYGSVQVVETIIHWDRMWGVVVFLALALLPAVAAARRRIWPRNSESSEESAK